MKNRQQNQKLAPVTAKLKAAYAWVKGKVDLGYLVALLISLAVALLIGVVILAITGFDPFKSLGALITGSFSSKQYLGNMLEYAMVLCLCGLACDVGSRAGIFNVGGEGQLILGALFAAQIGVWMKGQSPWLAIPCAALGAILVGGFYAFIPGVLKVKLKVNEVITTIMLNSVAVFICGYFSKGPWKNPNPRVISDTAPLDRSFIFGKLIQNSNLSTAILVSAGLTFLVWYVLQKTTKGYEMRMVGDNPRFARFAGIKADRIVIIAMVISGMMCGLVGMFRVYGAAGKYQASISNEYYFEGLMVAMIAQYQPLPTVIISLIFAILRWGAMFMEETVKVPIQIYWIIQTAVIFCMAGEKGIRAAIHAAKEKRAARRDIEQRREGGAAHE